MSTPPRIPSPARSERPDVLPKHGGRLLLASGLVLLSRLPWISAGYGTDPDSYRVVLAARAMAATGEYVASRLPGYPVHELGTVLVKDSAWASNGLTAGWSVVAFVFFALILARLEVQSPLLLAGAFAAVPAVYLNSVCTIDYGWALALILGSTYCALDERPKVAGVLLGLAIGCRITSGAMILPLSWLTAKLAAKATRKERCLGFLITALVIGGLSYLPAVFQYGLGFFTFYEHGYPSLQAVLRRATVGVWGPIGCLAFAGLAGALLFCRDHLVAVWRHPNWRRELGFCALVLALYGIAFLRLPHQSGYLLPAVPFVLLAVGRFAPPRILQIFCGLLLLSPWLSLDPARPAGPLWRDHQARLATLERTQTVVAAVGRLPGRALIVTGPELPRIHVELGATAVASGMDQGIGASSTQVAAGPHLYVYLLRSAAEYQNYTQQGYAIFYLDGIDQYNLAVHGLDLKKLGARALTQRSAVLAPDGMRRTDRGQKRRRIPTNKAGNAGTALYPSAL